MSHNESYFIDGTIPNTQLPDYDSNTRLIVYIIRAKEAEVYSIPLAEWHTFIKSVLAALDVTYLEN